MKYKIAFAVNHLSTGGMPRFVYNSIKYLDRDKYQPFLFEASHAHIDEIRNQILDLPNLTHHLVNKGQFIDFVYKYGIDLIHYHDWDKYARPVDIPSIETVHNPFLHTHEIGHADLYLLISEHQIKHYQGMNYKKIDTFIDNNEFNLDRFANKQQKIRNQYNFPQDKKIVMCIGILASYKNQAQLLKLWDPDLATLVFVGPLAENFKSYWEPLVNNYSNDRIIFMGAQKDIPSLLSIADVVINCSKFEGCCLSNLEAGAMKRPLVVSNIKQNTDIWDNDKTALVRPVDASFVEGIEFLLNNNEFASQLGEKAYKMVNEQFSVEKYTAKMDQIYGDTLEDDLISKRKKGGILYLTPGTGIEIPPKGWGGVEKVISELQKSFRSKGYTFDIADKESISLEDIKQYDFVHCHFFYNANWLYQQEIPYYLTIHDPYVFLSDSLFSKYEDPIKNSIKTIVSSNFMIERFERFSNKIIKIPTGVDTDFFIPNYEGEKDYLLCVGKTDKRKGFHLALQAAQELNLSIKIVGPRGDGHDLIEAILTEYKQADYLGEVSINDLRSIYQNAWCLVHPSSSETGPSLVVLEAMASGLPVIATKVCCSDFDHKGVIACERNVKGITEAILKIIGIDGENPTFIDFGRNNRKIVENNYTWDKISNQYIKLLYSQESHPPVPPKTPPLTQEPIKSQTKDTKNNCIVKYTSQGLRLEIPPESPSHTYQFKVFKNGNLSYENTIESSSDNGKWIEGYGPIWYTQYAYEVSRDGEIIEEDIFDLADKEVLIEIIPHTLGDTLAWVPYTEKFRQKHKCNLTVRANYNNLFKEIYPSIRFVDKIPDNKDFYFTYKLNVFKDEHKHHLISWRYIPLQQVATDMLGLEYSDENIDLTIHAKKRQFQGKYICIAPRSTMRCKEWNYRYNRGKEAWQKVVDKLRLEGYQIIWISREDCFLNNVIDKSGDLPLEDRITDLTSADFFIGLPAGLSWLAHACNTHVFMITGFSYDWCEFQTNITRISRNDVCRGCFNEDFEWTREWNWCPSNKQFQCTQFITPEHVIQAIHEWEKQEEFPAIPTNHQFQNPPTSLKTQIHANLLYWLVRELNPRYVVELGTYRGHTTLYLAKALKDCPQGEKLFTIDKFECDITDSSKKAITPQDVKKTLTQNKLANMVKIIKGNTLDAIHQIPQVGFAFIDACHTYTIAKKDFENTWTILQPGGIIALHDTGEWPGLVKLIKELQKEKYHFIEFFKDNGLTLVQKPYTHPGGFYTEYSAKEAQTWLSTNDR